MAFNENGKIWMNGKLVNWKDATIHVATHVIHYGTGVFEGIRAYESPSGTNVFRLREHMRRLYDSCRVYRMDPGYGFEELGPVNDDGEVVGGSSLLTASFEYEHAVRERWGIAFFVDTGNAFEGAPFVLKTGAGLGGRWQSPVGPVRIDVAHPFDDPNDDWRVHITLGPDL